MFDTINFVLHNLMSLDLWQNPETEIVLVKYNIHCVFAFGDSWQVSLAESVCDAIRKSRYIQFCILAGIILAGILSD